MSVFNGARFLVTGGAGFIGSNITEALLGQGCYVRVLDNLSTGKRENIAMFAGNELFEFWEGDIRNIEICRRACCGMDYVLHQGALGSVVRSVADPVTTNEVNISGTLNMLIAARDNNVKRFVYASSSSVYGDEKHLPKREDRVGIPLSPYAVTKKVNELYARNFFDLYGLKTVGLRYFNVFGRRQDPHSAYAAVIPVFVKNILTGRTSVINGDGEQSRDFTYIDNVVQANLKACLADEQAWGGVFNIACGERITINHLFERLCKLMGREAARIYGAVRSGDVRDSNADISRARELIDYQPLIPFDRGLELTLDWYKAICCKERRSAMSVYERLINRESRLAVIGLGYVGMPLAYAFARKARTIGFDVNRRKVELYRQGIDVTNEIGSGMLSDSPLVYTSDEKELSDACFYIVAVPTPIDKSKKPDLSAVANASRIVGRHLSEGSVVVYESTVYPGVTEEICVPILEEESGLECGRDFKVGYSPERINPGDRVHTVTRIRKIVSGCDDEALEDIARVYGLIVEAGVYRAESIKVAEAAKVIENAQRDINIAFMNELSVIFHRLEIDTRAVLAAAATKWNFLSFSPGLVGGHCIGVDPYYLSYKSELIGYHPQIILSGRRINDDMGRFVAESAVKQIIKAGKPVLNSKVLVMGMTFKENVADIRNSRVIDIINELKEYGVQAVVTDPVADSEETQHEYGISLESFERVRGVDAVVVAVAHREYEELSLDKLKTKFSDNHYILLDVKGIYDRAQAESKGYMYWSL